jgi:predicted alpha/beta hydrolase family esterase
MRDTAKSILFLQGGGPGAFAIDEKMAASLRSSLGQTYHVNYPRMPDEHDPNFELWRHDIEKELALLQEGAILVGHSVGAYILLRFLTEQSVEHSLAGIFLIATPFVGDKGWQLEGALEKSFATKLPRHTPIFLYHCQDDTVVPFEHLRLYEQEIPQATVRIFDQGGHQLNNDLSRVAEDIKRIS